jgi:MFS family permease
MYVAEIAPAKKRGVLVAVTQLNILIGILAAYLSNFIIGQIGMTANLEWRWMFGVEALPAGLFGLLLIWTPESPRWLVRVNRLDQARDALHKLGTDTGDVEAEIQEIETSLAQHRKGIRETVFQAKYLKVILLAIAIAAFNQLSGINAVLYYAPRIFEMTGLGEQAALLNTVGLGLVNLVVTVLAMLAIDRFGRRTLMLVGSVGYVVSLGVVAITFVSYHAEFQATSEAFTALQQARQAGDQAQIEQARQDLEKYGAAVGSGGIIVLIGLATFVGAHAFGQGAVIGVFLSEVFPNAVRAAGQSIGVFTHWALNGLMSWLFPLAVAAVSPSAPFFFFCGAMVLQLIWVVHVMPETKGVPLEKMQEKLGIAEAAGSREPAET